MYFSASWVVIERIIGILGIYVAAVDVRCDDTVVDMVMGSWRRWIGVHKSSRRFEAGRWALRRYWGIIQGRILGRIPHFHVHAASRVWVTSTTNVTRCMRDCASGIERLVRCVQVIIVGSIAFLSFGNHFHQRFKAPLEFWGHSMDNRILRSGIRSRLPKGMNDPFTGIAQLWQRFPRRFFVKIK